VGFVAEKIIVFYEHLMRRWLPIGILMVLTTLCVSAQDYRIYINPDSKVIVYGSTNVNRFTFRYTEVISINKAVHVNKAGGVLQLSDCMIDLKVHAFDSGNGLMNKDFRTMMNEKDNPFISVELLSISPEWQQEGGWQTGKVEIEVEINSIKKRYFMECKVENPGSLLIHGRQRMMLTDFELVPPTRMMGMVKVSEVVELNLALRFATDR
jgi:hypothetical protein